MTKRLRAAEAIVLLATALLGNAPAQAQNTKPQRSFVEVDGAKLYYEECGSAPQVVVLVHDGVLDSAVWDDVWPDFCKHFQTIRYDRRGYGRSPAAAQGYYATDDLAAILHHLKIKRVAIVGARMAEKSRSISRWTIQRWQSSLCWLAPWSGECHLQNIS